MTMRFKLKALLGLMPPVLILDQWSKFLVLREIQYGARIPVIGGVFDLVHVPDQGAPFGMLSEMGRAFRVPFFYFISVGALLFLAYYFWKLAEQERFQAVILSLLFGGILGNLIDRIRFGNVIDFLSFYVGPYEWPAFNVADSAITVAMILLLLQMLLERKKT